jgi:hypothetical protein
MQGFAASGCSERMLKKSYTRGAFILDPHIGTEGQADDALIPHSSINTLFNMSTIDRERKPESTAGWIEIRGKPFTLIYTQRKALFTTDSKLSPVPVDMKRNIDRTT